MTEEQVHELLDIAEQAKAEGDEATFQKATSYAKAAMRGPWHTPGSPMWRPKGHPESGKVLADASIQGILRNARAMGVGATRAVTGPGQLVTAGAEAVGIPGASVQRYTEDVNALERQMMGGGELDEQDRTLMGAGELLAGVATPVAGARGVAAKLAASGGKPLATRAAGVVGQSAGSAGLAAAQTYDPGAQTTGDVASGRATGAAVGAVAPAIPALPQAGLNIFRRVFSQTDPQQAGTLAQITDASDKALQLPLGAVKGTELAKRVESQVAGEKAKQFYSSRYESIRNRWLNFAADPKISPQSAAAVARKAVQDTEASMQKAASDKYETTLEEAYQLANPYRIRSIPGHPAETRRLFEDFETQNPDAWQQLLAQFPTRERQRIVEAAEALRKSQIDNKVPLVKLMDIHRAARTMQAAARRAYNSSSTPTPAQATMYRYGRDIMDAVDNDIERLREASPIVDDAWGKFEEARRGYRTFIAARDDFDASVVKQAFGQVPPNAEKAWDQLMRADTKEQLRALTVLNSTPAGREAVTEMKRWKIRQVGRDMVDPAQPGDVSKVSPERFIKQLTQGSDIIGREFWTPAELAKIRSSIATAQVLMTKAESTRRFPELEGMTMAVASRSIAFLSRHMFRLFGQGPLENLIFDPQAQKALTEVRELMNTGKPVSAASMAWITTNAAEERNPED